MLCGRVVGFRGGAYHCVRLLFDTGYQDAGNHGWDCRRCQYPVIAVVDDTVGGSGTGIGHGLASMLNASILVAVLHRRLGRVDWGSIGWSALRVLVACIPVVLICLWVGSAAIWTQAGEWMMKSVVLIGRDRVQRHRLSRRAYHAGIGRTGRRAEDGKTKIGSDGGKVRSGLT